MAEIDDINIENEESECGKNLKARCKTIVIDDVKYRTTLTKKYENRQKWEKPDEKKFYSFIPGTIQEVFVKEGDALKKGDKILTFEAMKMSNTIYNEHDSTIEKIHVKVGDIVPKGFLMLEFSQL